MVEMTLNWPTLCWTGPILAEMAETARAVGSPFLEGYVRLLIDAANLRSAVRCARMGKGSDF